MGITSSVVFGNIEVLCRQAEANITRRARSHEWCSVSTERLQLELHARLPARREQLESAVSDATGHRARRTARRELRDFIHDTSCSRTREQLIAIAETWLQLNAEHL